METDPAVSGRWGPSVVLRPTGAVATALDALTTEALVAAGPGHWATGSLGAAHVTVRALGRWGAAVGDAQLDALRRAVGGPVTLRFEGVRRTETAVLVMAHDVDGSGDALRMRYGEELGADGSLEDGIFPTGRAVWYATIVHFAAPVADGLTAWVEARAEESVGTVTFDAADVCGFTFDGRRMVPDVIATVPLQ